MTEHLRTFLRVSEILGKRPDGVRAKYWVTSKAWAELVAEVEAAGVLKPEEGAAPKPRRGINDHLYFRDNLHILNAGTDDQRFVNAMNWREVPEDWFLRRDAWRTG